MLKYVPTQLMTFNYPVSYKENPVLVVIVAKDCFHLTEKCIKTLKQHADVPYDILYVDDNSERKTLDSIAGLSDKLKLNVEIIENPDGIGFAKACNIGFERNYRHVLLLNSDCFIGPNCLSRIRDTLESDNNIACVGPLTGDDGAFSLRRKHNFRKLQADKVNKMKNTYDEVEGAYVCDKPLVLNRNVAMLPFFCTMFRHDAIMDIGYQDNHEGYPKGLGADGDWCRRSIQKKWRNVLCHNAFAAHLGHASFEALNIDRKELLIISQDWLYKNILLSIIIKCPNEKLKDSLSNQKSKNFQLCTSEEDVNLCEGDYIQIIDNDCILQDNYIEELEDFIRRNKFPEWIVINKTMIVSKKLWMKYNYMWDAEQEFAAALWDKGHRPVCDF